MIDDTTKKKSGKKIEGAHYYRNGAGSARQEYRTLWGLNFVYLTLSLSWQGHRISVPLGLRIYFKESVAQQLGRPFASRSILGRQMLDFIARMLPHRQFRVLIDGGYATKDFLRKLPPNVEVVGRFPINSTLYELPPKHNGKKKAGRPPQKGASLGNPKQWKEQAQRWKPHPLDPQLLIQTRTGIWHAVLPGILIRVVAIARTGELKQNPHSKQKPLETFFSTDLSLSSMQTLQYYHQRWDIEIDIRDANAYYGLGKDRCRNLDRITAVNTFRIIMAASRTLWLCKITRNATCSLQRLRPWYRQKTKLSQLDISSAFNEALLAQGVFPTIRFLQDMPEIYPTDNRHDNQAA